MHPAVHSVTPTVLQHFVSQHRWDVTLRPSGARASVRLECPSISFTVLQAMHIYLIMIAGC
jgi:hypothetical protein